MSQCGEGARWVFLLALTGCGRLHFDESGGSDPLGPFTSVEPVSELHSAQSDDDPTLTADMLEVFFDSNRPGGPGNGDVWTATRTSTSEPFGTPTLVTELASTADDTSPNVSLDGLTMYFASTRATNDRELFVTTRPDRASSWTRPARLLGVSSSSSETSPVATEDGLHLYFATNRNGSEDIYVASRTATDQPWSGAMPVAGLADPAYMETELWINGDATTIYLMTDRSGNRDIWMATRERPDERFSALVRLDDMVNSDLEDTDPWLSPDGHTLYFARVDSGLDYHIYRATR